jgi:GAF domain-containing protein
MRESHDEGPGVPAAVHALAAIMRGGGDPDELLQRVREATKVVVAGAVEVSLSVPLEVGEKVIGALNVYSAGPAAFDVDAIAVAYEVAQYAGIVVAARDELTRATALAEQMREAMESRAVIEQAEGVLMAEHRCSADEAFAALVRASQDSHRKLRDIATMLVERTVS